MNIKNIIFPKREGLEGKWWHRLVNVLIIGSSLIILLISFFFSFVDNSWKINNYYYSFEPGYQDIKAKESPCSFSKYSNNFVFISCGDLTNKEFLDKFTQSRGVYNTVVSYRASGVTDDYLLGSYIDPSNKNLFAGDSISYKEKINRDWYKLIGYLGTGIVITLLWFILWESIIYRVFLYIIYGDKK